MKKLNFYSGLLIALCLITVTTSCSDNDDESLYSQWETYLDNHTVNYTFDNDSNCYGSGGAISEANFEKMFIGYGWKHYGTWEIDASGKRLSTDYYKGRLGSSPSQYYFPNNNTMISYYTNDANAKSKESVTISYTYARTNDGSFVLLDDGTYLQITGWTLGETPSFCVVHPIGVLSSGKKVFGVSIYSRMSEKELKEYQN